MPGWFACTRDFYSQLNTDNRWNDEPFSKSQALFDLHFSANFSVKKLPNYVYNSGDKSVHKPVEIPVGGILTSIRSLAKKWRWTAKKVRCFLQKLELDGDVEIKVIEMKQFVQGTGRGTGRGTGSKEKRTVIIVKNYAESTQFLKKPLDSK